MSGCPLLGVRSVFLGWLRYVDLCWWGVSWVGAAPWGCVSVLIRVFGEGVGGDVSVVRDGVARLACVTRATGLRMATGLPRTCVAGGCVDCFGWL